MNHLLSPHKNQDLIIEYIDILHFFAGMIGVECIKSTARAEEELALDSCGCEAIEFANSMNDLCRANGGADAQIWLIGGTIHTDPHEHLWTVLELIRSHLATPATVNGSQLGL